MWYGLSSIFARFLNYLLTPYLTYYLTAANYGEMSLVYSAIPFMNVVFTYGMETAYFRFSNKGEDERSVFNTAGLSLICSTLVLTAIILLFRDPIAQLLKVDNHPQFITWTAWILALDTLSTLPFAKLRNDGRPRKYAMIRVLSILVNIGLTVFFYTILPKIAAVDPDSFLGKMYDPNLGAGYVILANLVQSALTLLLLAPEFLSIRFEFNKKLWNQLMLYSLPLMIAGFGGMINETFDRLMLGWWAPVATEADAKVQVGIYSACYKLSILITLFIQAFRMGAEPFFFQQAKGEDAPKTYARVMNYFVIIICLMFLVVALYLDVWKHFITNPIMWEGLKVVPILLIANMCLGVYYNLSIWYKLSQNTRAGATITFIGAGITLLINAIFIPHYSYLACAWATLSCYASMMLISYFWGQKVYPVPYASGKLLGLFGVMLGFYFVQRGVCMLTTVYALRIASATALIVIYLLYVVRMQKDDMKRLPVIGKYLS
ncbi:MAG: polysaccharide biosynthesis protein [Sphingobacteriales bacterium]|nr:MAG: polysaccharide biosynthesis protein [Sphingobacteriales bacterium]